MANEKKVLCVRATVTRYLHLESCENLKLGNIKGHPLNNEENYQYKVKRKVYPPLVYSTFDNLMYRKYQQTITFRLSDFTCPVTGVKFDINQLQDYLLTKHCKVVFNNISTQRNYITFVLENVSTDEISRRYNYQDDFRKRTVRDYAEYIIRCCRGGRLDD